MKILRLPLGDQRFCHDCHNPATVEVDFGSKRPVLRLCTHDLAYLVRVGTYRLEEIATNKPIPKPRGARDDDSKGNR